MRENKTESITVRMTKKEQEQLTAYCVKNNQSYSFALRQGIDNIASPDEDTGAIRKRNS